MATVSDADTPGTRLTVDALLSAFDECYPLGDDSLFQRSANLKKQIMESIKVCWCSNSSVEMR